MKKLDCDSFSDQNEYKEFFDLISSVQPRAPTPDDGDLLDDDAAFLHYNAINEDELEFPILKGKGVGGGDGDELLQPVELIATRPDYEKEVIENEVKKARIKQEPIEQVQVRQQFREFFNSKPVRRKVCELNKKRSNTEMSLGYVKGYFGDDEETMSDTTEAENVWQELYDKEKESFEDHSSSVQFCRDENVQIKWDKCSFLKGSGDESGGKILLNLLV